MASSRRGSESGYTSEMPAEHMRRRSAQVTMADFNTPANTPPATIVSNYTFGSTHMKASLSDDEHIGYPVPRWQSSSRPSFVTRHLCAILGWLIALSLLFTLLYTVPTLPQQTITKLRSYTGVASSIDPALAVNATQGVTIVSAFFLIESGKKHRVDGQCSTLQCLDLANLLCRILVVDQQFPRSC